jgi:uncharacterized membrane protein YccC
MTHCSRRAMQASSRALVTTTMTAILAIAIVSPFLAQQADPRAQPAEPSLPKFCLKSQDANGHQVCFTGRYDGPPTDPQVFMEQQKRLQEELQRRADEARKRLENRLQELNR